MKSSSIGQGMDASAFGSTSSSLLARIKAWDTEAWGRFVDLYTPRIYRWCRNAGLQPEDAADVVQDVLASVARSIADFRGAQPRGSFRAWLRAIARHRLVDHFRGRQGLPQAMGGSIAQWEFLQVPDPPDTSASDFAAGVESTLWRRALELVRVEFEPRTWQAFWCVVVDAKSPRDVANELGMTLHAVYKAKSRVLRRLRTQFGELEGDGDSSEPPEA